MARPLTLLLTTLALGLTACGSGGDQTTPASKPAASASTPAQPEAPAAADASCAKKDEASGDRAQPCPTPTLIDGKPNVVTFKTSQGSFAVTLDTKRAPITSNSVAYLVKQKFYDGLVFHRVVPKFVIQGGDPLGDTPNAGTGGPGYQVTEPPPADQTYTRGVVAMAKGGADPPGASGSQFFVVSAPDVGLPAEYALVGKVTEGLSVVDKITALGEGDGPPRKTVTITSATLSAG